MPKPAQHSFGRALCAAALALALLAAPAIAQQRQSFDIAEQPLADALMEYSRRTGVVVVAPSPLLAGKRAPHLQGVYTPEEALTRLLSQSGLSARRGPEGGVALVRTIAETGGDRAPQLADIVVTGRSVHSTALAYSTSIAGRDVSHYERWKRDLCPRVAGLTELAAQSLIDHLAQRAAMFGVATGQSDCRANVVIVFATEADRVAREIADTRRDLLGYGASQDLSAEERARLDAFVHSTNAVRWWHVTMATSETTLPAERNPANARSAPPAMAGNLPEILSGSYEGADAVRAPGTRMRRALYPELSFVLVIVDVTKADGAPARALGDYLALVALARVDAAADMSAAPSILNLFNDPFEMAPTSLTAWDIAYLHGLYQAEREGAPVQRQRAEIVRIMSDRISSN